MKLLLTVTVADPEQFTPKGKPLIYTRAFVKLYNWKKHKQIYEIYKMIELEKMHALTTNNLCNLGPHRIIEIFLILQSAYVVLWDQDKVVFYINNYINWNEFNQLYDLDLMEKDIQNADVVARKLWPALIRATNHRLEDAIKKKQKREKIVKKQKAKALVAKCCRTRKGINWSNTKKENYESDTKDDMDIDQANDKYSLQL